MLATADWCSLGSRGTPCCIESLSVPNNQTNTLENVVLAVFTRGSLTCFRQKHNFCEYNGTAFPRSALNGSKMRIATYQPNNTNNLTLPLVLVSRLGGKSSSLSLWAPYIDENGVFEFNIQYKIDISGFIKHGEICKITSLAISSDFIAVGTEFGRICVFQHDMKSTSGCDNDMMSNEHDITPPLNALLLMKNQETGKIIHTINNENKSNNDSYISHANNTSGFAPPESVIKNDNSSIFSTFNTISTNTNTFSNNKSSHVYQNSSNNVGASSFTCAKKKTKPFLNKQILPLTSLSSTSLSTGTHQLVSSFSSNTDKIVDSTSTEVHNSNNFFELLSKSVTPPRFLVINSPSFQHDFFPILDFINKNNKYNSDDPNSRFNQQFSVKDDYFLGCPVESLHIFSGMPGSYIPSDLNKYLLIFYGTDGHSTNHINRFNEDDTQNQINSSHMGHEEKDCNGKTVFDGQSAYSHQTNVHEPKLIRSGYQIVDLEARQLLRTVVFEPNVLTFALWLPARAFALHPRRISTAINIYEKGIRLTDTISSHPLFGGAVDNSIDAIAAPVILTVSHIKESDVASNIDLSSISSMSPITGIKKTRNNNIKKENLLSFISRVNILTGSSIGHPLVTRGKVTDLVVGEWDKFCVVLDMRSILLWSLNSFNHPFGSKSASPSVLFSNQQNLVKVVDILRIKHDPVVNNLAGVCTAETSTRSSIEFECFNSEESSTTTWALVTAGSDRDVRIFDIESKNLIAHGSFLNPILKVACWFDPVLTGLSNELSIFNTSTTAPMSSTLNSSMIKDFQQSNRLIGTSNFLLKKETTAQQLRYGFSINSNLDAVVVSSLFSHDSISNASIVFASSNINSHSNISDKQNTLKFSFFAQSKSEFLVIKYSPHDSKCNPLLLKDKCSSTYEMATENEHKINNSNATINNSHISSFVSQQLTSCLPSVPLLFSSPVEYNADLSIIRDFWPPFLDSTQKKALENIYVDDYSDSNLNFPSSSYFVEANPNQQQTCNTFIECNCNICLSTSENSPNDNLNVCLQTQHVSETKITFYPPLQSDSSNRGDICQLERKNLLGCNDRIGHPSCSISNTRKLNNKIDKNIEGSVNNDDKTNTAYTNNNNNSINNNNNIKHNNKNSNIHSYVHNHLSTILSESSPSSLSSFIHPPPLPACSSEARDTLSSFSSESSQNFYSSKDAIIAATDARNAFRYSLNSKSVVSNTNIDNRQDNLKKQHLLSLLMSEFKNFNTHSLHENSGTSSNELLHSAALSLAQFSKYYRKSPYHIKNHALYLALCVDHEAKLVAATVTNLLHDLITFGAPGTRENSLASAAGRFLAIQPGADVLSPVLLMTGRLLGSSVEPPTSLFDVVACHSSLLKYIEMSVESLCGENVDQPTTTEMNAKNESTSEENLFEFQTINNQWMHSNGKLLFTQHSCESQNYFIKINEDSKDASMSSSSSDQQCPPFNFNHQPDIINTCSSNWPDMTTGNHENTFQLSSQLNRYIACQKLGIRLCIAAYKLAEGAAQIAETELYDRRAANHSSSFSMMSGSPAVFSKEKLNW